MTNQQFNPYIPHTHSHASQPLMTATPSSSSSSSTTIPIPASTLTNPTSPSSQCSCFSGFTSSFLILLLLTSVGCGIATLASSTWFTYITPSSTEGSYYTVGPLRTCYYSQNYFSQCYISSCSIMYNDYTCSSFIGAQVLQTLGVSLSFLVIIPMIVTHFVSSLRAKFVCRLIASIVLIISTSALIITLVLVHIVTENLNASYLSYSPTFAYETGTFTLSIVSTAFTGFTTFLYIIVAIYGHKKDKQALGLSYVPLSGAVHHVQDQQPNHQVYLQPSYVPSQHQQQQQPQCQIPKSYPQVSMQPIPSQTLSASPAVVHHHHPQPQTSTLVHPQPYYSIQK